MNLLHALAALLTILLVFVRQQYFVTGAVCPAKKISGIEGPQEMSPVAQARVQAHAQARPVKGRHAVSTCAGAGGRPRYKRDPDILLDNEYLGVCPSE